MKNLVGLVLLTLLTIAPAAMADIIVPNANGSSPGGTDNRFPFLVAGGQRYQQVFGSSQFSGPITIGEIDFRNGINVDEPFTATISDIQISLSIISTAPDALSSTFASNLGADNTQVYSGSLTISSTNAAGPGGTHVFDIAIDLQTPFTYDPSLGNLLLDIQNISGATAGVIGSDYFDAVNASGDSVSRVYGAEGSPSATTGTVDSLGLIAKFDGSLTNTPEPGSSLLAGLGIAAIVAARRKASKQA